MGLRGNHRSGGRALRTVGVSLLACLAVALIAACGVATRTRQSGDDGTASTPSVTSGARPAPIIYRPAGLSMDNKVPLVVALYGTFGSPQDMEGLSHFEKVADEHGFVVAYLGSSDPVHPWKPPSDLNYVSSMIDQITASENIDPSRVYVTGFSAGGYETWRAGCELSTKVAAIAIVSGAMNQALTKSCSPKKPVAQLLMVGRDDGTRWTGIAGVLPSAIQTAAKWRSLDGCTSNRASTQLVTIVTQETWSSCADGSAVGLYVIPGAGHVWPPYGPGAPKEYHASEEVWAFLSAHHAAPLTMPANDATLLSLGVRRSAHRRWVHAKFRVGEPLKIIETIGTIRRRLVRKTFQIRGGPLAEFNLNIAAKAKGGSYTDVFAIRDIYGRTLVAAGTVHLPNLPTPPKQTKRRASKKH